MMHLPVEGTGEREMTLAEWADMGEDEPGELVDGRLVDEEEVGALHDMVAAWLVGMFHVWLAARGSWIRRFAPSKSSSLGLTAAT
jgi:hypothetical protein